MRKIFFSTLLFLAIGAAAQNPLNPITTSRIQMPIFAVTPAPAISANFKLNGNPGPRTVYYWIVAKYLVGDATVSGPYPQTNAPNTIGAANSFTVSVILPPGATAWDLLRTDTAIQPVGACACATVGGTGLAVGATKNDTSNTTNAYTVNPIDINTLAVIFANEVTGAGANHIILRTPLGVQLQDLMAPTGAIPAFPLRGPSDSLAAPNYSFTASSGTGMYRGTSPANFLGFGLAGSDYLHIQAISGFKTIQVMDNQAGIACGGLTAAAPDACFWLLGSGQVGLGNATPGDFSGNFRSGAITGGNTGDITGYTNGTFGGKISGATIGTATNCSAVGTAANPSVASCSAAPAGSFSCATNATGGTCRVNTTAVTANSQIIVIEDETLGTRLGVTCNTSTNVLPASRLMAARSAGASFTINLGTVTTNPACFSYSIVN